MGGMAAFIPSRRDAEVNAVALRQGPRRQDPRGGRRVRRVLGGASRPGTGVQGGVRRRARHPAQPARPAAPRGDGDGKRPAQRGRDAGRGDRGRAAEQHLGRPAVPGRLARRHRRGGDLQPDGGRRDRGDLRGRRSGSGYTTRSYSTTGRW